MIVNFFWGIFNWIIYHKLNQDCQLGYLTNHEKNDVNSGVYWYIVRNSNLRELKSGKMILNR